MRVKSFSNFVSAIYEVETQGTYLGHYTSGRGDWGSSPKYKSKLSDSPKTDTNWGLKFEGGDNQVLIRFPDNFIDNFLEAQGEKSKDPKFVDQLRQDFEELKDRFSSSGFGIEGDFNRTHFSVGITDDFKGTGLGYVIYEELIKYLGFASSASNASESAQKVWSKIATDPDFLGIASVERIMVIYKKNDLDKDYLSTIIGKFISKCMIANTSFFDSMESKNGMINLKDLDTISLLKKFKVNVDKEIFDLYPKSVDYLKEQISEIFKKDSFNKLIKDYKTLSDKVHEKYMRSGLEEANKFYDEEIVPKLKELDKNVIRNFGNDYLDKVSNILRAKSNGTDREKIGYIISLQLDFYKKQGDEKRVSEVYQILKSKLRAEFESKGYNKAREFLETELLPQTENLNVEIVDDYSWCSNTFKKYFSEDDNLKIKLLPKDHLLKILEILKKSSEDQKKNSEKKVYKKLSLQLRKSLQEGGYQAASKLFDEKLKKEADKLTTDIFDDPNYGTKPNSNAPFVKYSATEHLKKQLELLRDFDLEKLQEPNQVQRPQEPKQSQKPQTKTEEPKKRSWLQRFRDFIS